MFILKIVADNSCFCHLNLTQITLIFKKIIQGEQIVVADVDIVMDKHGKISTKQNVKAQIYKGMIQYLLETTPYTIKNIADLSHSSVKTIRTIFRSEQIPMHFSSELNLLNLYHMTIEFHRHLIR